MWSCWYTVAELEKRWGITAERLERWVKVGYAEMSILRSMGMEERTARIRGFVIGSTDELDAVERTVMHAERVGLKGGAA